MTEQSEVKVYRPEGDWYKDRGGVTGCAVKGCRCNECVAYEAGADALLEGLRKKGTPVKDITLQDKFLIHIDQEMMNIPHGTKGVLVFIPEEVKP